MRIYLEGQPLTRAPRERVFNLDDRRNREVLAAEAKARVEASEQEARRTNDPTKRLDFSDALNAIIRDVQAGKLRVEGLEAEA